MHIKGLKPNWEYKEINLNYIQRVLEKIILHLI